MRRLSLLRRNDTRPDSTLKRRQRVVLAAAVGAVAVAGGGFVAGQNIQSPAQAAADAAPPQPDVLTATVQKVILRSTVALRGTVVAVQPVTIGTAAVGNGEAAVVTQVGVRPGDAVRSGQLLLGISGRPLIALVGSLPAYRDLKPNDDGPDVVQLQYALHLLGYGTGGDRSGHFGAGTAAALNWLYQRVGYQAIPVNADASQEISDAQFAVSQAGQALQAARDPAAKAQAAHDLEKAQGALSQTLATNGPTLPASEVQYFSTLPAQVNLLSVNVGSRMTGSAMTLSSGGLEVRGYLQSGQQSLVHAGQGATIQDGLSGFTAGALVESVGSQQATSGQGQQAIQLGFPVRIRPNSPLPNRLLGQDVQLTVQSASTKIPVLVVPLSAITESAANTTVVVVVDAHGDQRRVAVSTGSSANGLVQVTAVDSGSLEPGDKVVVGAA